MNWWEERNLRDVWFGPAGDKKSGGKNQQWWSLSQWSGNCFCFRVSWLLLFGKLQIIRRLTNTNTNTTIRWKQWLTTTNDGGDSGNPLMLTTPAWKSSHPANGCFGCWCWKQTRNCLILLPVALLEVSDGRPSPLPSGSDPMVSRRGVGRCCPGRLCRPELCVDFWVAWLELSVRV